MPDKQKFPDEEQPDGIDEPVAPRGVPDVPGRADSGGGEDEPPKETGDGDPSGPGDGG